MERMDRLWKGGPAFFYDDGLFKPGTDAFLLGAFARPRARERVCDLGAGTLYRAAGNPSRVPFQLDQRFSF